MNAGEKAKTKVPGREMISGMIWWSKSIKEMTRSTQIKANQNKKGRVRPNLKNSKTQNTPVRISTRGYLGDIGVLQPRHRPRKARKLKIGILQ